MKSGLIILTGAILVILIFQIPSNTLAQCGGGYSGHPRDPDTFIYLTDKSAETFDPATSNRAFETHINEQVCETLINFDGDTTALVGELATSWVISNDGLNYTFTLRQGIEFTDGTQFNAWVMKYSIDRTAMINDNEGLAYLLLDYIKGGPVYSSYANPNVSEAMEFLNQEAIKVIDDYTISIYLNHPFTPLLSILNKRMLCALSPKFIIEKAPDIYVEDLNNTNFGMVDLNGWFPELGGNFSNLGMKFNHPSSNSGVVPGSYMDGPAEHIGFKTETIGTGPYKFLENKTDTQIRLIKNTDWWNAANFHADAVDEVIIRKIVDGKTRLTELEAGNAKSIFLNQSQYMQLLKNENGIITRPYEVFRPDLYTVYPVDKLQNIAYYFNLNDSLPVTSIDEDSLTSNYAFGTFNYNNLNKYHNSSEKAKVGNPFTSVLFRKAFSSMIDHIEIINTIYSGMAIRMEGVIPRGLLGHHDQLIEDGFLTDFRPITAKSLFEEVGWKGTIYFVIAGTTTLLGTIASLIKNQLDSLNIGINIIVQDIAWNGQFQFLNKKEFPLSLVGWNAEYADPHNFVEQYLHSTKGIYSSFGGYHNQEIDLLIEQASNETNPFIRAQIYSQIEQISTLDAPMIYIAQTQVPLINRAWVTDIVGSGALNPMYKGYLYHSLGLPDVWYGPIATCSSSTTTFTSTTIDPSINTSSEYSFGFIQDFYSLLGDLFSFAVVGGVGGLGGGLVAILIRRYKN
ncbi:MAG: ABC transporter substrate-binding protein [Candidatus Hodarchaeales archaeon]|jgi:peptide/nickel transport system substrate-binding protein